MNWLEALAPVLTGSASGYLRGRMEADEAKRVREERAKLEAARVTQQNLENARNAKLDAERSAATTAATAAAMDRQGFKRFQSGMLDRDDETLADATSQSTGPGMMGGMMQAAGGAIRAVGAQRAPSIAEAQGGYIKRGMSETERIREDEREARQRTTTETLAQRKEQAEAERLARAQMQEDKAKADLERARESNNLRRDLGRIAASGRSAAGDERRSNRNDQLATRLRGQYEKHPAVKNADLIASSLENVKAAAQQPDAAGDLSMLFAYMKILDPNSVVRETEFANAENAAGIPDRIKNLWNRAKTGQRLTVEQRREFVTRSEQLGAGARRLLAQQNKRYTGIAEKQGVDPSLVVFDPFDTGEDEIIPPKPAPRPTANPLTARPTGRPPISSFFERP